MILAIVKTNKLRVFKVNNQLDSITTYVNVFY